MYCILYLIIDKYLLKCLNWVFICYQLVNFIRKLEKVGWKIFPPAMLGVSTEILQITSIIFWGLNFMGELQNDSIIPSEDVKKYILATSHSAKGMQTDINHYVTRDRINNASFRQNLDPIGKNIIRRQNPLEFFFEVISTFDAENAIVGSLLRELDVDKKDAVSDLVKKAPRPPGLDNSLRKRLKLSDGPEKKDDNNNDISPPPSPPPQPPPSFPQCLLSGPPQPPPFVSPP